MGGVGRGGSKTELTQARLRERERREREERREYSVTKSLGYITICQPFYTSSVHGPVFWGGGGGVAKQSSHKLD